MEIAVFAKKRQTKEGKTFYSYLSRLTKKDGTEVTASVKFRDTCVPPRPEECPMNIIIQKQDCSFNSKSFIQESTGLLTVSNTLWVGCWMPGQEYIDTSMDEFI